MVASVSAIGYTLNSNSQHVKWSLGCAGGPVCVLYDGGSGNATVFDYRLRIVSLQDVTGQFINITIIDGPSLNIVYSLNGTIGSSWLFGPYTWKHNHYYNYDFHIGYNGTYGTYELLANVVQLG